MFHSESDEDHDQELNGLGGAEESHVCGSMDHPAREFSKGGSKGEGGGKSKASGKGKGKAGGGPERGCWECGGSNFRKQCIIFAQNQHVRKATAVEQDLELLLAKERAKNHAGFE